MTISAANYKSPVPANPLGTVPSRDALIHQGLNPAMCNLANGMGSKLGNVKTANASGNRPLDQILHCKKPSNNQNNSGEWKVPLGANPKNHLDKIGQQANNNGQQAHKCHEQPAKNNNKCDEQPAKNNNKCDEQPAKNNNCQQANNNGQQANNFNGPQADIFNDNRADQCGQKKKQKPSPHAGNNGGCNAGANPSPIPPEAKGSVDRTYRDFTDKNNPNSGDPQHKDKIDQYGNVYTWDKNYGRYTAAGVAGSDGVLKPYSDQEYQEMNKLPISPETPGSVNRQYTNYGAPHESSAEHPDKIDQHGNVYTWDQNYNRYEACGVDDNGSLKAYSDQEYSQFNQLDKQTPVS